jgi:hypothetical protein
VGGKENQGRLHCEDEVEMMTSLPGAMTTTPELNRKKFPLQRKPSNLTSDSGRSSTMNDQMDSVFGEENGSGPRRHSLSYVDSTGHLHVPGANGELSVSVAGGLASGEYLSSASAPSSSGGGGGDRKGLLEPGTVRTSASFTALSSSSPNNDKGGSGEEVYYVKRAPKIVYSHSEDRLTAQSSPHRPIIPALPYSPYASPTASPRLRRQPTMETHRVSVSDADGYTQLNQYRLKDEIGKVRRLNSLNDINNRIKTIMKTP